MQSDENDDEEESAITFFEDQVEYDDEAKVDNDELRGVSTAVLRLKNGPLNMAELIVNVKDQNNIENDVIKLLERDNVNAYTTRSNRRVKTITQFSTVNICPKDICYPYFIEALINYANEYENLVLLFVAGRLIEEYPIQNKDIDLFGAKFTHYILTSIQGTQVNIEKLKEFAYKSKYDAILYIKELFNNQHIKDILNITIEPTKVPVTTFNVQRNPTAWCDRDIFQDYMQNQILSERCSPNSKLPLSLLIMDNASSHYEGNTVHKIYHHAREKNIILLYLPPNSTGFLQPLDLRFNNIFKKNLKRIHKYIQNQSLYKNAKFMNLYSAERLAAQVCFCMTNVSSKAIYSGFTVMFNRLDEFVNNILNSYSQNK